MKTIIVPTDFSEISNNAAFYAAEMANAIKADILLSHIVSLPMAMSEVSIPPETIDLMMNDATSDIEELKSQLQQHTGNTVNITYAIRMGDFTEEIADIAEETDVFAIVMGIQGADAAERMLLGSNAFSAIHKLPYPVIIVPAEAKYTGIKNIALACNMHDVSETIPVGNIEQLVSAFSCKLHVVYVSKPGKSMNPEVLPESLSVQHNLVAMHPQIHFLENDHVDTGILEFVQKEKMDLLLMVPEKRSFISSLFHKSVSNTVALGAHLPIMNIHN